MRPINTQKMAKHDESQMEDGMGTIRRVTVERAGARPHMPTYDNSGESNGRGHGNCFGSWDYIRAVSGL